ncbi:DnaJ domain-containing protein [Panaeolus papilionaceus]|nr:DnaJ domain-containing protein [Panaeolus papilionaceus]
MAPTTNEEEEQNPYELLGVKLEATDQEIKTAYRQRSLKVHPDRNPNNPDAARKFHELNQAYELLLDPLRRLALDAKQRVKQARAERYKNYDLKRRNMVEELEERERALKKARVNKQKEEKQEWEETERIKEAGRKLREEKERLTHERLHGKKPAAAEQRTESIEADDNAPPPLGDMDTTVKLKYPLKSHPNLTTTTAISNLLSRFGETDTESIVLSLKGSKKHPDAPPKNGTALVPFKQIASAFAAVCASGIEEQGLEGLEISWLGGSEPKIIAWLKRMGHLGKASTSSIPTPNVDSQKSTTIPSSGSDSKGPQDDPFSTFPSTFVYFESLTLMRLRQAERERLEKEILEQEANEG